ncbi:hypothetical protein [Streptomyces sp. NBC_00038]|uniref:hypothetical protein n=1 Tax=Streptomyces sp. NBC_00038 TaxID=2903615 RepID=UPI00225232CF|nr:hypothetical protein [Streptomyces sp. NBC_00038]MCX5562762.1 hypothetical protein [Streptomyces sp. NBC_00038]MCX5563588.1 hypothetical protein [Streptomyces sp. NBC_00038]
MSARTVIEHALRVYYADSRDPNGLVETLLAKYDAERAAIPPLWVADYDGAPLTLHLTREAARDACDDVAKVDAHGQCWDWRTEDGDVDRQFWTHADDDRPTGYTGGSVWQVTVEGGEQDTRGGSPQQGESTHRHPRPCEFPTVLPCRCPRPSALPEASFIRARHRGRIAAFFRGAAEGHAARSGAAA